MNRILSQWVSYPGSGEKSKALRRPFRGHHTNFVIVVGEFRGIPGTPYNGTKLSNQACFVTW